MQNCGTKSHFLEKVRSIVQFGKLAGSRLRSRHAADRSLSASRTAREEYTLGVVFGAEPAGTPPSCSTRRGAPCPFGRQENMMKSCNFVLRSVCVFLLLNASIQG